MSSKLKILFLEDNVFDYELICRHLKRSDVDFEPLHVHTREDYIEALEMFKPDIILSDHRLPQFDSIAALEIAQEKRPLTPFVLVTGSVSEEFAATCIKKGAFDYVLKDNMIRLSNAVSTAMDRKLLVDENTSIKSLVHDLETSHKVIASKNKDIVDSINYASKIQSAILPELSLLDCRFPGSFVLYRPKDIIGGDFYWMAEKNDRFYLVVGDCTGHGVPGCMLSMIGHNLLNSIVHIKETFDPADILYKLNNELMRVLNNKNNLYKLRDGMDIGLLVVDVKADKLEYAAARRPLYAIKNGNLEAIPGNPISIGETKLKQNVFTTNKLKLSNYSRTYMSSDGYADQFGGERNKKITTKKFKEMLVDMAHLDGSAQKEKLDEYMRQWQNENEQTDDVLVIGINLMKLTTTTSVRYGMVVFDEQKLAQKTS